MLPSLDTLHRIMNGIRLSLALAVFASTGAAQQEGEEKPKPPQPPRPIEVKQPQDPKKAEAKKAEEVKPLTAADRVKLLKRSLEIAKRELGYLKEVETKGGLGKRFSKMRAAANQMAMLDPANMGPVMPKKRKARLLGDAEKLGLGKEVVMTVAGNPVTQAELDNMLSYLRSFPRKDSTKDVQSDAILALIQAKAGEAVFAAKATQAKQNLEVVAEAIRKGQSFADIAGRFSDDKDSAKHGGRMPPIRRGVGSLAFNQAAFSLKVGEISKVIPSVEGFHIIRVMQMKKGDSPEQDKVTVSHILKRYTDKPGAIKKLQEQITRGELDVAFRSDELRKFVPAQFK